MFVHSYYWNTWSRVLSKIDGQSIEINLTPANDTTSGWLNTVALEVIRCHSTVDPKNKYVNELPSEIRTTIATHLGSAIQHRLLSHDYISDILSVYGTLEHFLFCEVNLSNGGGIPYKNVMTQTYYYWG